MYGIKYLYEDGTLGHAWIVLGREQPHSEIINNPTTGETISLFIPVAYGFGPGINDIVTALLTLLLIPVPGDKRTNEDRKYKALFDFAKAKNGYMPITTVKEYDTYILEEKGAVLKYGDKLDKYGKPVCCKKISSDDFSTKDYGRIKSCIAKHKFSSIYNGFYSNCRQVARDVLHDCCLRTTFEDDVPGKQPAPLRYTV